MPLIDDSSHVTVFFFLGNHINAISCENLEETTKMQQSMK